MINSLGGEQDNVVFMGRRSFRMEIAGVPGGNELAIPMRASEIPTERIFGRRPGPRVSGGRSRVVAAGARDLQSHVGRSLSDDVRVRDRADADVRRPGRAPPNGRSGTCRSGTGRDARAGRADRRHPTAPGRGTHGRRAHGGVRAPAGAPPAREAGTGRSPASGSRGVTGSRARSYALGRSVRRIGGCFAASFRPDRGAP